MVISLYTVYMITNRGLLLSFTVYLTVLRSRITNIIVRAMWVNSDTALLQEWACRAIWTLSVDQTNKDLVVEAGGINAIVNAMMAHTDVAAVQEKACGCLANLAANVDDNKMKIAEA